jgi:serine/threonine protein phosphatase PrpC
MEDRAVCVEDNNGIAGISLGFYAVYDGHNGPSAADFLSAELYDSVVSALRAW